MAFVCNSKQDYGKTIAVLNFDWEGNIEKMRQLIRIIYLKNVPELIIQENHEGSIAFKHQLFLKLFPSSAAVFRPSHW